MLGDWRRVRKEKERTQRRRLVLRVERGFSKLETCFEEMRVFSTQFDCSMKVLRGLAEDLDGSCDEGFLMEVIESKCSQVKYDKRLFCGKCRSGEHFEELLTEVTETYSGNGYSEDRPQGNTGCGGCGERIVVIQQEGGQRVDKETHETKTETVRLSNNEHTGELMDPNATHKNLIRISGGHHKTESFGDSEMLEEQRDQISLHLAEAIAATKPSRKKPKNRKQELMTWGELIDIKDESPDRKFPLNKTSLKNVSEGEGGSGKALKCSIQNKNMFRFDSDENKDVYSGSQSPKDKARESFGSPNVLSSRVLYSEGEVPNSNSKKTSGNHTSIQQHVSSRLNSLAGQISKKSNQIQKEAEEEDDLQDSHIFNIDKKYLKGGTGKKSDSNDNSGERQTLNIKINGADMRGGQHINQHSDVSRTEEGEVVNDSEFERRMFQNQKRLDKRITFGADTIAAHVKSYQSRNKAQKLTLDEIRSLFIQIIDSLYIHLKCQHFDIHSNIYINHQYIIYAPNKFR